MSSPSTPSIKTVIFDFDGTIADTLNVVVTIANRLAGEFGYEPVSYEQLKALQQLSSRQIIRASGIPLIQVPFLLRRVRAELTEEIKLARPIEGMPVALRQLQSQGYQLGIATSNSKPNVLAFLEANSLQTVFQFVYSELTLFGKGQLLRRIMATEKLEPPSIVYVGDETRDIEAAKQIGIKSISVAWGFNAQQILASHHPDRLIYHPEELPGAVASFTV